MIEVEPSSAENEEVIDDGGVLAQMRRLVFIKRGEIGWSYVGEVIEQSFPTTAGIAEGLCSGADQLTDVIVEGVQLTYRELEQALKGDLNNSSRAYPLPTA